MKTAKKDKKELDEDDRAYLEKKKAGRWLATSPAKHTYSSFADTVCRG